MPRSARNNSTCYWGGVFMPSCEQEPSKKILLTLSPVFSCSIPAALVIPVWIILHLNKAKMVNAEYMDVFFAALLLLGIISGYMDYLRYHITFDQNGIDICKWRKKIHASWNQITSCVFTKYAYYKHVTLHIKKGEESYIISTGCTSKQKNYLSCYLQQSDIQIIDSWNKQKTR